MMARPIEERIGWSSQRFTVMAKPQTKKRIGSKDSPR